MKPLQECPSEFMCLSGWTHRLTSWVIRMLALPVSLAAVIGYAFTEVTHRLVLRSDMGVYVAWRSRRSRWRLWEADWCRRSVREGEVALGSPKNLHGYLNFLDSRKAAKGGERRRKATGSHTQTPLCKPSAHSVPFTIHNRRTTTTTTTRHNPPPTSKLKILRPHITPPATLQTTHYT
jgi:hypothetical protein